MKFIPFALLLALFLNVTFSQDFDKELQTIAENLAYELDKQGDVKVAVWPFVNTDKQETNLGKYIGEDFSVHLTKDYHQFQVMDRYHLDQFLNEHQLNADGYIDIATAKKLGKMHGVDYIITGTVAVFNRQIKLRVKVLHAETASQIIARTGLLPIDDNIASFLGVPGMSGGSNRGFNGTPVASNEQYNNPEKVNQACEEKNTGDFCFENTTSEAIELSIWLDGRDLFWPPSKKITLLPKQTSCLYDLTIGTNHFIAKYRDRESSFRVKEVFSEGDFKVEQCKSLTHKFGGSR